MNLIELDYHHIFISSPTPEIKVDRDILAHCVYIKGRHRAVRDQHRTSTC